MREAPYTPFGKHYRVRAGKYPVGALRKNKLAAGMSFTASRSGHQMENNPDRLTISVFGTLDPLRTGVVSRTTFGTCACCGSKTKKLVLTDSGRLRLKTLRSRAARRRQKEA